MQCRWLWFIGPWVPLPNAKWAELAIAPLTKSFASFALRQDCRQELRQLKKSGKHIKAHLPQFKLPDWFEWRPPAIEEQANHVSHMSIPAHFIPFYIFIFLYLSISFYIYTFSIFLPLTSAASFTACGTWSPRARWAAMEDARVHPAVSIPNERAGA